MLSVIDTELWLSAVVETEVTVGAVVSVVEDELSEPESPEEVELSVLAVELLSELLLSELLLQEITVKLKRDMRIICKILFIFFSLRVKRGNKFEKSHILILESETLSR